MESWGSLFLQLQFDSHEMSSRPSCAVWRWRGSLYMISEHLLCATHHSKCREHNRTLHPVELTSDLAPWIAQGRQSCFPVRWPIHKMVDWIIWWAELVMCSEGDVAEGCSPVVGSTWPGGGGGRRSAVPLLVCLTSTLWSRCCPIYSEETALEVSATVISHIHCVSESNDVLSEPSEEILRTARFDLNVVI